MTDKLWEQQRYKQNAASLVEAAHVEALASLLRPFYPSNLLTGEGLTSALALISRGEDRATAMAREYYSGEAKPKRLEELETLLSVHAISPEQIRARAMEICGSTISAFQSHGGQLRVISSHASQRDCSP